MSEHEKIQIIFDCLCQSGMISRIDEALVEEHKRKGPLYDFDYARGIAKFLCDHITSEQLQEIVDGGRDERSLILFHAIPLLFRRNPTFMPPESFQKEAHRRFPRFNLSFDYKSREKEFEAKDFGSIVCIGKFNTELGTFYQYMNFPCFGPGHQAATKVKGECTAPWYSYYEDGSGFAYIELADWPTYQKYLSQEKWSSLSLRNIFVTEKFLPHLEFAEKHISHELVIALNRNYFHDMLFHVACWRPRPWLKEMLREGIEIYKTQFLPKFGPNLNIECMFGLAADTCSLFEYTKNYSHSDKDSNFSKDVDMFIKLLEEHGILSHLF